MARIAGINIPPHKHTEIGLTAIYGIGRTTAQKICTTAGVPFDRKVKDLTDGDLEKIRDEIGRMTIEGYLRREMSINIKRLMDWVAIAVSVTAVACRFAANAPRRMPVPARVRASPARWSRSDSRLQRLREGQHG